MRAMRADVGKNTRSDTDGDDEIVRHLRQEFLDDSRDRAEILDRTLADLRAGTAPDGDAVTCLRREAHNLKGTGAAFGFPVVSLIAHRLEDYLAEATRLEPRHVADAQKFVDALSAVLEGGVNPDRPAREWLLRSLPAKWSPDAPETEFADFEVLLITPSKVMGAVVGRLLQKRRFRIVASHSAASALFMAVASRPDLIIASSVQQPIGGVDIARAFAAMSATRDLPFALMTSHAVGHRSLAELPESAAILRAGAHFEADLDAALRRFDLVEASRRPLTA